MLDVIMKLPPPLSLKAGMDAFKPKKVDTREVSTNAQERARKNVNEATEAMLDSQNLIFDLLWSHLQDGRVVKSRHYPVELEIKGVSHGRPA